MSNLFMYNHAEVAATAPGDITNIVDVKIKDSTSVSATASRTVTLEDTPALTVTKSSDYDIYYNGDAVTFTIVVSNNGNPAIPRVKVFDTVPPAIVVNSVTLNGGPDIKNPTNPNDVMVDIGTLPGNTIATIEIKGTVDLTKP